jgi:type VI protein secretion system component Hcp
MNPTPNRCRNEPDDLRLRGENSKLHKGKKLEAQKQLKTTHGDISITKHIDVASPRLT